MILNVSGKKKFLIKETGTKSCELHLLVHGAMMHDKSTRKPTTNIIFQHEFHIRITYAFCLSMFECCPAQVDPKSDSPKVDPGAVDDARLPSTSKKQTTRSHCSYTEAQKFLHSSC